MNKRFYWVRVVVGSWLTTLLLCGGTITNVRAAPDGPFCHTYPSAHQRLGFNFTRDEQQTLAQYDVASLQAGWYLDYSTREEALQPTGPSFVQVVRAGLWQSSNFTQTITTAATTHPGALWLVGNEPDRAGQDGQTPSDYARFYHTTYHLLKRLDPYSRVAIAGVVQVTPLRLRYLDQVLAEYQRLYHRPLAVDVWNVHGFILPENYIWGAAIPPGLDDYAHEGQQYTALDHDSLAIFQAQIENLRRWMAERGYRDKPLVLSEYGILLSPQHGFTTERVQQFMLGTFDYLLNATDPETGYPADGNRLVQKWSWFSLNSPVWTPETRSGFNGNLYNPATFEIEPLGQAFADYAATVATPALDLAIVDATVAPVAVLQGSTTELNLAIQLVNGGTLPSADTTLRIWLDDRGDTLLSETRLTTLPMPGCQQLLTIPTTIPLPALPPGHYTLTFEINSSEAEFDLSNNQRQRRLLVLSEPFSTFLYLPIIGQ